MATQSKIFIGMRSIITGAGHGETITRQQLIDKLGIRGNQHATVEMDNIRNMYTGAGCLVTVKRGVYNVICRRWYERYTDLKTDYNERKGGPF